MRGLALLALAGLAACAAPGPGLRLERVGFDALPGWTDDRQDLALTAFRRSCAKRLAQPSGRALGLVGGHAGDWQPACRAALALEGTDAAAARVYFETWFVPYRALGPEGTAGLFTGYYEPTLAGSRRRSERFTVPIYGRPDDLVTVDLADFAPDLGGRRLVGRLRPGRLAPYPDRAAIEAGAVSGTAPVIAWVDDPIGAFFLQIQGSGRIRLAEGGTIRVGYAAANGRAYVSIDRVLVERGALALEQVSLQSIRAWLASHPDEADAVMAANPSYVFFRVLSEPGPVGAEGVVLTPGRSLAVDRRQIPLGVPLWLDTEAPGEGPGAPDRRLRRLVVSQDTGGAIRGPVRGDVFWGAGARAEWVAGHMRHRGGYYLLLPRTLAPAA